MALRDFRISRSLVISGVAVCATVGICVGTLLFLRPWPEHRAADAMVSPAEASIHAPGSSRDGPDLRAQAFNADDWPETTGRSSRLAAPGASPLEPTAEKQAVAAPATDAPQPDGGNEPEGAKLAALTPGASDVAPPVHTGATPKLSTPMNKAEMDDALKPLLSYDMSDEDVKNLKEAIRLIQKDEFTAARLYMAKLRDSGAQKLATWYAYRSGAYDATAWEIAEFRDTSKLWPDRDELGERVEDALFWRENNPRKVLDYFREHRPVSGPGKAALGNALVASGKADEGTTLIREAWRQHLLTPAIESRLKDVHGERLRAEDHKARLDWLFVKNRKSDLKAIDRLVPLVDKKWEKAVQAQIATLKGDKNAGTLLSKLDDELRIDPAILLARIAWARRNDKDDEAVWELLRAAPTDSRKLINPMSWWDYRETQVRAALNAGQPKTAYALAQGYGGGLPAEELSDAEFLSGWIALRFLDDAKAAHKHLLASAAAGGLPKHRARAGYWLGRAELALGNKRAASARFADAAQYTHTFYGQLSRQIAEPKATQFALRPYARPTAADIRSFTRNPVLRAMAAAHKADLEGLVPVFLTDLARSITSAPEMTLLCETAERVTGPHRAVRIAKIAMNRGFPVERYAYPDVLPEFKMLASKNDTEEALIHALTRQESEFNPTIVSSAGAMGLMQLLPSTAKEVAKAHDIKFDKKKLNDPGYNLQLGSAFLHRLISSYNGSYVMALAAYNAGPGRVRTWVGQFGDPRDKKTDPIDWIERIPFKETREYVLKIMESAQVYRARLNRNGDSLRLAQDLNRGRPDSARTVLEAGMH
jgi:soluble lytic murein transglycosylase